jgi:hypothetical protein
MTETEDGGHIFTNILFSMQIHCFFKHITNLHYYKQVLSVVPDFKLKNHTREFGFCTWHMEDRRMHAMPTVVVVGSPNSSPGSTLGSASLQQRRFLRKESTNLSIYRKNPAVLVPIWSINKTNTSSSSYI